MTSGYSGFINDIKVEPNPCGTIEGQTTYHHDFKKTEKKYMDLHHKNHFRSTDGIPAEYSRLFKQHHTDVTNNLNNLSNVMVPPNDRIFRSYIRIGEDYRNS